MTPAPPRNREGFEIALICALPLEADCVQAVFDKFWIDEGKEYGKARGDSAEYTTGVIGEHNVVLAYLPGMGKVGAAGVASSLKISFPNIKLAIVAGVCGGVPYDGEQEILLGDIVVSQALVQYDFGRQLPNNFKRKDTLEDNLGRHTPEIRSVMAKFQTQYYRRKMQEDISTYLESVHKKLPVTRYPGIQADKLYESLYVHKHHQTLPVGSACDECSRGDSQVCSEALKVSCEDIGCDNARLVPRQRLTSSESSSRTYTPIIHYGTMGSGDTVMRSGEIRDKIAHAEHLIAYEMEGAGVWDYFPSLVVKGVCDYADSHKSKGWQKYAAATAACYVRTFLQRWTPEDRSTEQDTKVNTIWHVPFDRMDDFVGRANELDCLRTTLFRPDGRRRVAVHGLGGVGKSRIAWEIANHSRSQVENCSVFWIQANSVATFERDYLEIGEKLNIPRIRESDSDMKNLVKKWLSVESAGKWLMILDNADDESIWNLQSSQHVDGAVLADYIPVSPLGSVLITTRSRHIGVRLAGKGIVELRQMEPTEAVNTLKSVLADDSIATDTEVTSKLVEQLSFLPLALVQAAAYINMNGLSVEDYAELLSDTEEGIVELLSEDFDDETRYRYSTNPVARTWLVSFRQIQQKRPKAIEFLCYMSCLSEKDIPGSLLPEVSSPKELLEIIGTLTGYSFIRKQTQDRLYGPLYDMHRLVRLATRSWLKEEKKLRNWIETTVKRVAELFPSGEYQGKEQWTLYMPHAKVLCASAHEGDFEEFYELLCRIGNCLQRDGAYKEAIENLSLVVQWREERYGDEDEATLIAYAILGITLKQNGDLNEAEKYLVKACNSFKTLMGSEHPQTLEVTSSLVSLYWNQGRWDEAERLGVEVLESRKRVIGAEHPDTLISMGSLALTYQNQGRWDEAERLGIEVLETSKRVLGVTHRDTLVSLDNLAMMYQTQGRWKEAERLGIEALEINKRVTGVEHPDTLVNMDNLALTYQSQGRWDEAERLGVEVLETKKRVIGAEHPQTLVSMGNLAWGYHNQKKWDVAERLGVEVLLARKRVLGVEHPHTLVSMSNLALTYLSQGREDEAEQLGVEVLESRKRVIGVEHPDTLVSMGNLALTYLSRRQWDKAERLGFEVLDTAKRLLGAEHPNTLAMMGNLAYTIYMQDRAEEAQDMLKQCVELSQVRLGPDHPLTKARRELMDRWHADSLVSKDEEGLEAQTDLDSDARDKDDSSGTITPASASEKGKRMGLKPGTGLREQTNEVSSEPNSQRSGSKEGE